MALAFSPARSGGGFEAGQPGPLGNDFQSIAARCITRFKFRLESRRASPDAILSSAWGVDGSRLSSPLSSLTFAQPMH
jgi:hypothetical protein